MATNRRQWWLLGALAATIALAVWVEWPQVETMPDGRIVPRPRAGATTAASRPTEAPDVHLRALAAERPKPSADDRDLFKFKPKAPPPRPTGGPMQAPARAEPSGPPPPPPVPAIALKCIGILEDGSRKIAILSDGRGAPIYGKEGDAVLGQYRLLHIGAESIDMAYLDGRGRQTIRLSGS